jgi:4-hydroxybutyrate CoA-transferase
VSLGVSVDTTVAALKAAKVVIAQVNPNMPRTHGDGIMHVNSIDAIVEVDDPIPERNPEPPTPIEARIGEYVASLVEDGATLQMGIGAIPDAVLKNLGDKKRLGIHTEMFSDGVLDLVEKGIITGEDKVEHPNKIVTAFLLGSRKLYDFVNDNPLIEMREVSYTNNAHVISRNPKVTAINSAIEIDLTGQVCADSIGGRIFSGVGGQMEYVTNDAIRSDLVN